MTPAQERYDEARENIPDEILEAIIPIEDEICERYRSGKSNQEILDEIAGGFETLVLTLGDYLEEKSCS